MREYFDPPLLEISLSETMVDLKDTPYFYNNDGVPTYVDTLPKSASLLPAVTPNADIVAGNEYMISEIINIHDNAPYGIVTEFCFDADQIEYAPLWASQEVAAAFGMALIEKDQAIEVSSPVNKLSQVQYQYGAFAGHWSPYLDIGGQLLTCIPMDLEHHNFPHIFASTDPHLPLVISVARYWPKQRKIRVADIWVPQGCALYIPPKPNTVDAEFIDLHHNRNAALACWEHLGQSSLTTHTLLQQQNGFFYWFWNRKPTIHHSL